MARTATVKIWNHTVGVIAIDEASETGSFEFEPSFLTKKWDLSPLKMPVSEAKGRIFSFPELKNDQAFKGLPGLIADVLPDRYGNALINAWLARNGRPSGSLNPVEILCFVGKRGMGALEFEPPDPKGVGSATKIEIADIVQVANDILSGRKDFSANLSVDEEKALLAILKIGTSAGGARAKAVIAYNPDTKEIRSGQADAPKGFKHWIMKFDGVADDQFGITSGYGRVEMAYHLMAVDAEIEMTECRLYEENGRAHFMTRRFDRDAEQEKLHFQSFCAMQHFDFNDVTSYSYEQLFETLRMLGLPYPQAEQLFRRMVFNALSRNCDDHTKNFAFIMNKEGDWRLSPAFDVCHSYRPGSVWVGQQSLSINARRKDFTRADFLSVAKKMNIRKADQIITQVNNIVQHWHQYAGEVNVSPELTQAIQNTLIKI
ncbi:MAG: type II toxin-antitoxin system HipA family toxin [Bacteroidetes bacterium]|nr:type II toxin-antitoxin system HipA family toxin [Bacteroidota bacterium]